MNGRQRIEAAMRGEMPDRVPVLLHNFMMAAREAGYTMAEYRWDARKMVASHLRAAETYGCDGILLDVDTATLADAVGVPVSFPEHEPARASGGCLHLLEDAADRPPPDLNNHARVQEWLEAASRLVEQVGEDLYVRGHCDQAPFSLAGMMRTPERWTIDLLTEGAEPFVEDVLEYCTAAAARFVRLMAATGAAMVSSGDDPAGSANITPGMYRRFAMPYERRLAETAHECGCAYGLSIAGNAERILPDLLATGADGLDLSCETDAAAARDAANGRAAVFGAVDVPGGIARAAPADVEAATRELLDVFAETPGFILGAGGALPADTPPENVHAMVRTARAFRA